jgi:predicted metal-dependent phosphotriesterase family hydrolase
MAIMTVNGLIEAGHLGLTLPHEHSFCDTSGDFREPPEHIESLLAAMGVDLGPT